MNKENCTYTEKINGITYVVNLRSSDNANKPVEDYIKALIADEILS